MAIATHNVQSAAVINPATLTKIVPIFVALMVWVIRILIIGTLSTAGDRLLWSGKSHTNYQKNYNQKPLSNTQMTRPRSTSNNRNPAPRAAAPRNSYRNNSTQNRRPEPTYHSLSASGGDQSSNNRQSRQF